MERKKREVLFFFWSMYRSMCVLSLTGSSFLFFLFFIFLHRAPPSTVARHNRLPFCFGQPTLPQHLARIWSRAVFRPVLTAILQAPACCVGSEYLLVRREGFDCAFGIALGWSGRDLHDVIWHVGFNFYVGLGDTWCVMMG